MSISHFACAMSSIHDGDRALCTIRASEKAAHWITTSAGTRIICNCNKAEQSNDAEPMMEISGPLNPANSQLAIQH
jgi:hypothetical protein